VIAYRYLILWGVSAKIASIRYDYDMEIKVIGIVGGGQLGRMLTEAALPLGFQVIVVDPEADCPAAQAGARQIVGTLDDKAALQDLAAQADVITVEIEHVDTELLSQIATGKQVRPAPETIAMIQDKFRQKQFLAAAGIPLADFAAINDEASARQALDDFGGKILLKTRRGAYDGRGNMVVSDDNDIKQAFKLFKDQPLYAEKFVPFQKELAVMVARSTGDETAVYPVVETIQERNICIEVIAPAQIDEELSRQAEQVALDVVQHLKGAGVFGIEMFLTDDNRILVNEIAPRVHNSGHYTIEACATSQFEQHIRAIAGLPLEPTNLIVPAAVMINILGERDGPTHIKGLDKAAAIPDVTVHLYGKSPTKIDRKMGHITATGATTEEARERARQARQAINV
jgi:5-(carboxyamino)imidazole ribonucleotide synthase